MKRFNIPRIQGIILLAVVLMSACQITPVTGDTQSKQMNPATTAGTPSLANTAVGSVPTASPTVPAVPPVYHALRIDYPDLGGSRSIVADLEQHARTAGINMIALGAGRVEWTYFKWAGHESVWANDVKDSGIDYLMEDTLRFGKWAHVNAVVDIFAPNWIKAHPDQAAINWLGVHSEYLVGTMDLVDGEFGQMVLDMIDAIATNYPVDSISITELFYHSDGYGPKEKAAYMAYTGVDDWPRYENGLINIDDKSIGDWRGYELDRWLDRAVTIAHAHGKQLFMDVALSLDNLSKMTNEHGTNYRLVLEHMDKLVIWAYLDLDNYQPEYLYDIAFFLRQFETDRIILSIGLWSNTTTVISPDKLKRAIIAASRGDMPNIWITPSSLMQAGHWQVLEELWGLPYQSSLPIIEK
jgi:hypothetical protein